MLEGPLHLIVFSVLGMITCSLKRLATPVVDRIYLAYIALTLHAH